MNTRFSSTTASSLTRTGCAVGAMPTAVPNAQPSPFALPAKAAAAVLLALALGACSTPVVSPELMAKSRISPTELSAMSSQQLDERRAELAQQRAEASAKHTVAEHTCWQQFAVTKCINDSARERREIHDQLRADDIALEDEQRKRKLERANERLELKQEEALQR